MDSMGNNNNSHNNNNDIYIYIPAHIGGWL